MKRLNRHPMGPWFSMVSKGNKRGFFTVSGSTLLRENVFIQVLVSGLCFYPSPSLGTTLAPAVGLHSLRPSAHNPIIQPPHQSIQEKFQAGTKYFVIWVILFFVCDGSFKDKARPWDQARSVARARP